MGCCISQLAAKFAFFPPTPATYQVKKRDDGRLVAVSTTSSMPISGAVDDVNLDVLLVDTKRGNKIVAFYLKNPYAKLTVLYSHGNAADLGQLYDLFVQLKANLRINLMGYDYSGYGASTGKPSEFDTYADIEAVYGCLQTEYGISQEDLILYGQSVGSGPTLHLAAKLPRLRGVVLHSGILSGLRVLCHANFTCCFDIYKNLNKIQKVKSPVLVIHGTEDDVVNWLHGKVHGSLARAGKVRGQTPKVAKQDKKKKPRGRAHKRMQYNRRFVTAASSLLLTFKISFLRNSANLCLLAVVGFGKKRGPNSSEK
ncbi:hypothetical protein CQW23_00840 [Capsicum baccatum]|uniref:Serine aminopeptidase S33 domain-containing protein n=1 Tax=Capsicum baccatum TaxID=33114 RepID=A0A2G2XLW8_CAPBA|nr:hypothetical protein CQW23_00840 [Capsicum baccatum]